MNILPLSLESSPRSVPRPFGDGIYEQTLASNSRGGAERAEHVPVNVFFGVSDAEPRRKPGQPVAGSNNKVFTAVLDDKPASLANGNHRAFGLYCSDPHLWGKLLRCFSHFRPEPFTDVVAVLCLCWLFALLFLPLARVGENRFVKTGEYLRLFGFHHLAMIVMNMDSNIKDNVEPVTWPIIEAQLTYWSFAASL